MAVSIRKKEEYQSVQEQGLLDASLMQNLQDRFCAANNLYLVCLGPKGEVVTRPYGSKEELEYLRSAADEDLCQSLFARLRDGGLESVMEETGRQACVKLCGVSVNVGGAAAAVWIVAGVMEEEAAAAPSCMMRTTPERYYKSIAFLETLSRQMFAVKMEELLAQEAFLKSRESEKQMEEQLHRNEAITAIVKMLESEESFETIVDGMLKEVCGYLGISAGALLRKNTDGRTADIICEYTAPGAEPIFAERKELPLKSLPFFNGKPYMISADSMLPDEFGRLFERQRLTAALFLPIEVSGRTEMYLSFAEKEKKRIWDVGEVKFVNDAKRIMHSILVKRIAKNSLASSYASLEAILENVGCGIYVLDPESGDTLYTNQRFRSTFRRGIKSGTLERYFRQGTRTEDSLSFREVYSEEEQRWFDLHSTRIHWVDGRRVLLGTVYDVTDKKLYQQKIEKQANNDFLTGLYNRMRCEQDLERCIRQSKERGSEGALLYIDLDDFKHINDGLGHQYGDILLKNISGSLKQIPGVENNCYRMGGDEFIIILTHQSVTLLQQILDEIKSLFTRPWMLKGADYYCTMSMGVVRFPTDGDTVEELIRKADIALYTAKCAGKNRIEFYDDNVESTSYKRLDLEKNMRNATQRSFEEFEVYFQPIVDISKEGSPCAGAEALVRWNSGELGLIPPTDFIPLAEYLGLINPIGDYVLQQACRHCRYWNDMGHPEYKVNVNLSVVQLLQNDIVERIRKALEDTGMIPQNLTLEVTESLAINDMNRMKNILAEIRKLGVRVALDDFGTGYSSLNHIREMPIDVIKIDRCFIIDIGKDDFSNAFVKMVAELANAIHVNVCVEGVETKEQLEALMGNRIQLIQGYYFGKPVKAEIFEKQYL